MIERANDKSASPADLEKLMLLLREYTQKLRAMCEDRATVQYRTFQMSAVAVGVLGAVMVTVAAFFEKDAKFEFLAKSFAPIGIVMALFFVILNVKSGRRSYMATEAEQVAATVERLVKLASQYAEHSSLRIGDRFEFELRLAEAEGALHTFRRIFQRAEQK